jgi:hypothetical protein
MDDRYCLEDTVKVRVITISYLLVRAGFTVEEKVRSRRAGCKTRCSA